MKRPTARTESTRPGTDGSSVAERLHQLAHVEQRRIERERQPPKSSPASAPTTNELRSRSEPSHRQLVESVALLRDFCRGLEHQSAYLSVRVSHATSSAEAEFAVGIVDDGKFLDSSPDSCRVTLLKTVRIGNVREDYEHTQGVAEILETGEVLRRAADLRAYLNDKLLPEIGEAIGRCRADHHRHVRDEPGAREELPLNFAVVQCMRLLDELATRLRSEETNSVGLRERQAAATRARAAIAPVRARLGKLYSDYEFEEEWPSVLLGANFAWLTPLAQALRARDLICAASEEVRQYAREQGAEVKDYESELKQAEANAERLADEAFYDVRLEKRLEADLEQSEEEYYHYHGSASAAEEVAAAFTECLSVVEAVMPDVAVALAARRGTSIAARDTSAHPEWKFND
jgi:F0F1-type ATP synthase membrane subunit b/b'